VDLSYLEGPPRIVPGHAGLLRMTWLLLKEKAHSQSRLLVLGAGGGLELKYLAEAEPGWSFEGVDPSAPMLELARHTLGPLSPRATLKEGTIQQAGDGPFQGATCLLTFHFLKPEERLETLGQLRRRLQPDAPLVIAHLSIPEADREDWIARYLAFSGTPDSQEIRNRMETHLTILTPEQDEQLLLEAGYRHIQCFYTAFTFRGWVAHA
jgi:tRNA (cmo5U34)-methyltransferase